MWPDRVSYPGPLARESDSTRPGENLRIFIAVPLPSMETGTKFQTKVLTYLFLLQISM